MKKIAINFTVEDYGEGLYVLYPTGLLIGTFNPKNKTFIEDVTDNVLINTDYAISLDMPNGFNCVVDEKTLKNSYKTISLKKACARYKNELNSLAFFYDTSLSEQLQIKSKEDFLKMYDIDVKSGLDISTANKYISDALNGLISTKELEELLGTTEPEKNLIQKDNTEIRTKLLSTPINEYEKEIKKSIISQDEAIKEILTSIYETIIFDDMKNNIFICGPTGVGKTGIIRKISELFDIPVHIEDISQYTDSGYVGSSPEDVLRNLYLNSNRNIDVAEHSILVLDEIDKKASSSDEKNFNKSDVLKSMLKIIEGGVFTIKISETESITFDTSHLIVIAIGAFSELYDTKKSTKSIGFNESDGNKPISKLTVKDFVKYGIPIEFLGRFTKFIELNCLSKEDLKQILTTSDLCYFKKYIQNLEKLGIKIKEVTNVMDQIVSKAYERKTGARALNSVVTETFSGIAYESFNNPNSSIEIKLNSDLGKAYTIVKREKHE